MATIACVDCGTTRTRCPSNTKYCWLCRLIRDLDHWRKNTRRCMEAGCRATFAPLGFKDRHCSSCNPGMQTRRGRCVLCKQEGCYTDPRLPVCAGCARDPGQRERLWGALLSGQRKRCAEHNTPIPHAPMGECSVAAPPHEYDLLLGIPEQQLLRKFREEHPRKPQESTIHYVRRLLAEGVIVRDGNRIKEA